MSVEEIGIKKRRVGDRDPLVYVIHENDEWVVPLREAFRDQNIPFAELHYGFGGSFDLTSEPPKGVFYSRMSASSHTRDHRYAAEHTHAVLEWLELYGRKVVNGSRALSLEISKVRQYAALTRYGIKVPRTVVVTGDGINHREEYAQELVANAELHFPGQSFITKHNRSGKGLGVRLFQSAEELGKYVRSEQFEVPVDGITLLQEYIKSPEGRIVRCEFVNAKFMYAVEVDTSSGFELCPADVCQAPSSSSPFEICPANNVQGHQSPADADLPSLKKPKFNILADFDHPILRKYEKFLADNKIGVAGIEFIRDANSTVYTFDVNTNTNYNLPAEKIAYGGMKGMARVAEFLGEELKHVILESLSNPLRAI